MICGGVHQNKFVSSSQGIMFIYNIHTHHIGCDFTCSNLVLPSKILLLEGRDGETWKNFLLLSKFSIYMCVIVYHVISPMWMAKLTHPWPLYLLVHSVCYVGSPQELPLCWFVTNVYKDGTWHV